MINGEKLKEFLEGLGETDARVWLGCTNEEIVYYYLKDNILIYLENIIERSTVLLNVELNEEQTLLVESIRPRVNELKELLNEVKEILNEKK